MSAIESVAHENRVFAPAEAMVRHMRSKTSMKGKGPEVWAPAPATKASRGRRVENS